MEKKVCKFDIRDLLPIGLTFVVLGIGLAYGLNVIGDVRDDMIADDASNGNLGCTAGTGYNCTGGDVNGSIKAIEGISKIPEKLPLIATVIVAAVIIGILIRYLMVRFG